MINARFLGRARGSRWTKKSSFRFGLFPHAILDFAGLDTVQALLACLPVDLLPINLLSINVGN